MANCMNAIVKCLGVELNEVFRIDNNDYKIHGYYKINEEGLYVSYSRNPYDWDEAFASHFMLLLEGTIEITKLPGKPAIGDMYWYPEIAIPDLCGHCLWKDDETDNYRFQHNFVFTDKSVAKRTSQRILDLIRKDENNG